MKIAAICHQLLGLTVRFGCLPCLLCALLLTTSCNGSQFDASQSNGGQSGGGQSAQTGDATEEVIRRQTAVTLNYCRAALHRIRRAPNKAVVIEEQQRILNNLNLNQIEDPEVISLYRAILDEIGQVEVSDRERNVIQEQYTRGMQRKLSTEIFVIGAQAATGQIGSVIQTGTNSWWDYRTTQIKRDADLWTIEKNQFSGLMNRSSTFLDSFWRLSRKCQIPDRWLLRDQDLDQLADVLSERDADRRLRMLARLEKFMECYPPYWYYVAKTQQQLGQLQEATTTYERLTEIGDGHFRQDDMLASSLANLAMIQEMNNDPAAVETAGRAFDYSNRNWESNLVCAWVLGRHQQFQNAEDRILCNLDYELENEQSSVALVSLYYHSDNKSRLAELLDDDAILARVPIPGLLLCARSLGSDQLPVRAQKYLSSTLVATRRSTGRVNSIAVAAASGWKLNDADAMISDGRVIYHSAGYRPTARGLEANFVTRLDGQQGGDGIPDAELHKTLRITLNYPGTPAIHVVMSDGDSDRGPGYGSGQGGVTTGRRPGIFSNPLSAGLGNSAARQFRIEEIEVDGLRLSFRSDMVPLPAAGLDEDRRVLNPEISIDDPYRRS